MNARYLIFGSLGLMLVLVGALLLIGGDPDGRDTDLPALTPAGDTAEVGGGAVRPDTLDGQAPGAGADSAGIEDGAPAGAAPADGGADGGADGVPVDGDTPVSSGAASEGTGPTSGSTRTAAAVSGASPGASPGTAGQGGGDAAPASSGPDLDAILRGLAARYEDVRSLQADFQQVIDNPLLGRRTESAGTLYQRQPDLFLMRFSDPEGDVIVSDGDYFWVYYPSVDPKQV
ncbi:MAG TPA: outer membrane lipoprotein carrier protein LolA, partial [Longimicrobiales bacterium]|nr:outer membrane lipoprotein carrier protein LolA [Longimicrobiales bacterium]